VARKEKAPPSGPNNGYLISFGDTMTALLAFFIVLNSLAKEQTGAKLYAGTGSFIRAMESMGMPGLFSKNVSAQIVQMDSTAPHYVVADPNQGEPELNPTGPDDERDFSRIVDREEEQFHRFLLELRRFNELQPLPEMRGEIAFDILGSLPSDGPMMPSELREALNGIGPYLRRQNYEVEITVWATTPSQTAWTRAVEQSQTLRQETQRYLGLNDDQMGQIRGVGRTWISSDIKRPAVSLTVRCVDAAP